MLASSTQVHPLVYWLPHCKRDFRPDRSHIFSRQNPAADTDSLARIHGLKHRLPEMTCAVRIFGAERALKKTGGSLPGLRFRPKGLTATVMIPLKSAARYPARHRPKPGIFGILPFLTSGKCRRLSSHELDWRLHFAFLLYIAWSVRVNSMGLTILSNKLSAGP